MSLKKPINRTYPEGFTYLIAEMADTAMKAIRHPDPFDYVEKQATAETLAVARMRRGMTAEERIDAALLGQYRLDVVRAKLVRDLAVHLIASFRRYNHLRAAYRRRLRSSAGEARPAADLAA